MKRVLLRLLSRFIFSLLVPTSVAYAFPHLQHYRAGVVRSVDAERSTLVLFPAGKHEPTEVVIIENRTKLRRDKKPGAFLDLAPGQKVRLHYTRESGHFVATDVTWTSGDVAVVPGAEK